MPSWSSLQAEVAVWTNRPDLAAESLAALKQALRTIHRSGKLWRDLGSLAPNAPWSSTTNSFTGALPTNFRAMASLWPQDDETLQLQPVQVDDLIDSDAYLRDNIYYPDTASTVRVRCSRYNGQNSLQLQGRYYAWPDLTDATNVTDWVFDHYPDLPVLLAASSLLGMIGEQQIKQRVDSLAAIAYRDLVEDNVELYGR